MVAALFGAALGGGGGAGPAATSSTTTTTTTPIDDPGRDSVEVDTDPEFAIEQYEGPYRIVYRLDDPNGTIPTETDRVVVRPPFESRLETGPGLPPGGQTTSVQVATRDTLRIGGVDNAATIARVPGLAPSTIRLAPIVDAALAAGLLELREQREVIGRRCQVYRSGSTFGAGPLVPITAEEFADTCVDGQGLLLEETLFVEGDASYRRTAVEVDLDHRPTDDAFQTGPISAPVDQGGGAVTRAEPDSRPEGRFFELPDEAVPAGYEHVGRFSVIPPQPEKFADPSLRDTIIAGVVDLFADDSDGTVAIYQGATLGQIEAFVPFDFAPSVDAPALGTGTVLLSALGTELRFGLDRGQFVHVYGTEGVDVLTAMAAALVETEGTGLVLVDE